MKNLILLITLLILTSCKRDDSHHKSIKTAKLINSFGNSWELEILEIDRCEYLFYGNNGKLLTHKGNCKNHRNN